jgi:SprA-related family
MRAALSRKLAEQQLQAIDAEVRAHEHAHVAALGKGVIQYDTITGPDGIPYAVGGGVAVDLTPVPGDPEATISKAKLAIQAAYAVGQPSGADIQVAREAYTMEMQAQQQLAEEQAGGGARQWYA